MAYLFDDFQKFGKGWQTIAAESSEYSKSGSRTVPLSSKSCLAQNLENAIQIQSEY